MIAGLAATTIFISFQLISSVCKELDVNMSTILHQLFWPSVSATITGITCWQIGMHINRGLFALLINFTVCSALFFLLLLLLDRKRILIDLRNAFNLLRRRDVGATSQT